MEREPIDSSVEKTEQEIFMEKVEKASPSTLEKIKETMKRPETWLGTVMLVGGGYYMISRIFEVDQQVVKETTEGLSSNTEAIKEFLLALKVMTGTVIFASSVLTFFGIKKGIHNAKVDKALEEEDEN